MGFHKTLLGLRECLAYFGEKSAHSESSGSLLDLMAEGARENRGCIVRGFKPGTICDKGTEVSQAALEFGKARLKPRKGCSGSRPKGLFRG